MNYFIVSSTLIVLAGFMAMSYRDYAEKYAWPRGSIWYNHEKLIGFLVWSFVIPGTIQLIIELTIFKGIGIAIACFIAAPIIMYIFKTWSQYLIYLFVILSIIIWITTGIQYANAPLP